MKLSEYFTLDEMTRSQTATRRGIKNDPPPEAVANLKTLVERVLEPVRLKTGPMIITSGYRNPELNAAVGGSPTSAHMNGRAVDIWWPKDQLPDMWIIMGRCNVPYDKLILEFGSWIHVQIAWAGLQPRRQRLIATRNEDGRTVYTEAP
jgi:hypothetical protein